MQNRCSYLVPSVAVSLEAVCLVYSSLLLYLLILSQVSPTKINGNVSPRGVNGMVKSLTLSGV